MFHWVRLAAIVTLLVSLLALGVGIGLFFVANHAWVPIHVPQWLRGFFDGPEIELWIPALIGGWLIAIFCVVVSLVWGASCYLRKQGYKRAIRRLEAQLIQLRNLPLTAPAPLEDIPEEPDEVFALALSKTEKALLEDSKKELD